MIQPPGHASHESCVRFTALPEVHAKMFRVGPGKFTRALSQEPPIPCRRTSLLQPIGHRDRHVFPDLTPQDLRSEPREQLSQSTSVLVCDLPSPIHLYDLRKHNLIYSERQVPSCITSQNQHRFLVPSPFFQCIAPVL